MDNKEFKKNFGNIATDNGFEKSFGCWFKENNEVITVLDLQKSNFGNYFDVNIKIFIQGCFGKNYVKTKELFKNEVGNIFTRQPNNYNEFLDLNSSLLQCERIKDLKFLFLEYIVPLTERAMSIEGIKKLYESNELFLLPAIKEELNIPR